MASPSHEKDLAIASSSRSLQLLRFLLPGLAEFTLHLFQIFWYINVLRTEWDALAALSTDRRPLVTLCIVFPIFLDHLIVFEHAVAIPEREVPWDVDTKGARHAVLAPCTPVTDPAAHGVPDLIKDNKLLLLKLLEIGEGPEVVGYLFQCGHAAEYDLYKGVTADPAQCKGG